MAPAMKELLDKFRIVYDEEDGKIFYWQKSFHDATPTDAVFSELNKLETIKQIELIECTNVTGVFLKDLIHHPLVTIKMVACPIIDKAAEYLANFSELESLTLTGAEVSDIGILSISNCKKLNYLQLRSKHITNKGFFELSKLTTLRELNIYFPLVSQSAIDRLRDKLPNCEIF